MPFLHQFHGKGNGKHSPGHESYPITGASTSRLGAASRRVQNVRVFLLGGPIEFRLAQFHLAPRLTPRPLRALVDFGTGRVSARRPDAIPLNATKEPRPRP